MRHNQNNGLDIIESPEPVLLPDETLTRRRSSHEDDDEREYEATELDDAASLVRRSSRISSLITVPRWYDPIEKFWREQIRVSVPSADCRDHLANERTYLGYLRTSLALSIMGVIVAQLYTIQHAPKTDPVFGYYVLGKPVASILQASALGLSLMGTSRFWRQQNAMVRGKVLVNGWEIHVICISCFGLLVGLFAIHVGVSIYKSTK